MKTLIAAGLVAVLAAATPALANHEGRDGSIDQRQLELQRHIERGWRVGELTPQEYRRLVNEAREIERVEQYYRADGRLSPRERGELNARLDHLAHAIRFERQDGEQRHGSYNYDQPGYRRF